MYLTHAKRCSYYDSRRGSGVLCDGNQVTIVENVILLETHSLRNYFVVNVLEFQNGWRLYYRSYAVVLQVECVCIPGGCIERRSPYVQQGSIDRHTNTSIDQKVLPH